MGLTRRSFLRRAGLAIGAGLVPGFATSCLDEADDRVLTGRVNGFTVPAGQRWRVSGRVESTRNVVVEGTLVMRPGAELRFVGVDEAAFVGGGDVVLDSDVGLWVTGAGVLDARGRRKLPWTRVGSPISAGARAIRLSRDPYGWRVGDQISITPTAPGDTENEDRVVAAISGRTVTFDAPLERDHPVVAVGRGLTYGAEVLNLARDVVIGGTAAGRAHVMVMSSERPMMSHVRIEHMGPRTFQGLRDRDGHEVLEGVTGRYGLHLHRMEGASRGAVIDGVVVVDGGFRAFVTHMSHGVRYRNCIAHRTMYSQFWWDAQDVPDFTDHVVYDRCVASTRLAPHATTVTPNPGSRQAGFSLNRGSGNVLRDCVAVSGAAGTWSAGVHWEERSSGSWVEQGRIVCHNNQTFGSFVWENLDGGRDVRNLVLYHNWGSGVRHGAYKNNYRYTDVICYGNGGNGPVELAALSSEVSTPSQAFQEWTDCIFDAAGSPRSLTLDEHRFSSAKPVRFVRCEFRDPAEAHVARVGSQPEILEFVECTFTLGVPEFLMGPAPIGTEWRVHDAGHGSIALTPNEVPGSVWNPMWQAFVRAL